MPRATLSAVQVATAAKLSPSYRGVGAHFLAGIRAQVTLAAF